MGNAVTSPNDAKRAWQVGDSDVVNIMMPIYMIKEEVTPDDITIASNSWNLVLSSNKLYALH